MMKQNSPNPGEWSVGELNGKGRKMTEGKRAAAMTTEKGENGDERGTFFFR